MSMATQPKPYLTPEAYLALEREAEVKHEYYAGEIFAFADASEAHNLIVANLVREPGNQLRERPCKAYPSDMRVKVGPTGLYTYPDVVVVCGEARFDDAHRDTLLNPTLLVEVLSPSTEGYDRGKKFEQYRKPDSLQEYLVIAQEERHVEHYARRSDNQWLLWETDSPEAAVELASVGCRLGVAALYEKVDFDLENESPP